MSVRPLITASELRGFLAAGDKKVRIIDASWYLPIMKRNHKQEYNQEHIPGAVFFDMDECNDKNARSGLDNMLAKPEVFAEYVGNFGVDNNTHVVVYDNIKKFAMFSAQRLWWMFRCFGYDCVSILDGGLTAWKEAGYETTDEIPKYEPAKFTAKFIPSLIKYFDDIASNVTSPQFQLVDARPAGRFNGTSPEPRPEIKPGHIDGSTNMPFLTFMDNDKLRFKTAEQIRPMFEQAGVDLSKPVVVSCGSGLTAPMVALGAFLCGKADVPVYDGAWTEWYLRVKPECPSK